MEISEENFGNFGYHFGFPPVRLENFRRIPIPVLPRAPFCTQPALWIMEANKYTTPKHHEF